MNGCLEIGHRASRRSLGSAGVRLRRASRVLLATAFLFSGSPWVLADTRPPHVAGKFYPEEGSELRELVNELLERQPEPALKQKPRLLIAPHAGYQYSGLITANAFRQLKGHHYDGVVVVAFTHRLQFPSTSVDTREAYETPLGEFPVDQEAVAVLQTYPGISHVEEAHETEEHSLEVELPFLQVVLGRVRLVPVLMGGFSLNEARQLADALAGLSQLGDYLFVFSTDLSHYHPYDEAMRIDEGTMNAILNETPQAVDRLFSQGEIEACGRGPILTSLLLAAKLGYLKRELLYHANSGDTAGNPSSVVGYAAIGMYDRLPARAERSEAGGPTPRQQAGQPGPLQQGGRLSAEAGQALVQAARMTLERTLARKDAAAGDLSRYPELSQARGLFVTLRRHGDLRGCIGRIQTDEPLARNLPAVAMDAALRDPRFAPVTADELPDIHVEVSVLTPPVKLPNASDLVAGRDGVVLSAEGHQGVFLPQVWDETGWTRVEFLRELASQKAGLPPDAWQRATLFVFQDQIFEEEPRPSAGEARREPLPASRTAH